jgi:WD40 repeat protein
MEGKHIIGLQVDPLSPEARMPAILTETQFIDLRTNADEGYRRLWKGLREEDILGVAGEWDPGTPPYLGLDAFQEEHAPVFFGREDETRAGLELLGRGSPGLVMVVGASGTGKSSLVRAGMLPRLRKETARWIVVDPFRPRGDPFTELATSLDRAYRRYAPDYGTGGWEQIRDELLATADLAVGGVPAPSTTGDPDQLGASTSGEGGSPDSESVEFPGLEQLEARDPDDDRVVRLLKQLEELREHPPAHAGDRLRDFLDWSLEDLSRIDSGLAPRGGASPGTSGVANAMLDLTDRLRRLIPDRRSAQILLVIDQFEELLGHDDPGHPANRFLGLLRVSLEAEHSSLRVLGTMRSDFLAAFQQAPHLRGIDFENLSLGSMRIDGMRRVIEEPARLGAIELERGLADRLLEDTETPDALPLLSFTLWKLWNDHGRDGRLTVAAYDQMGGLRGAVAGEAGSVLRDAIRDGREDALRTALLRMARVTEDGGYARQPVAWEDGALRPVHPILERFVDRRLLSSRSNGDVRVVEVAHEALFRSWGPLKGWLDNHRAELMLLAQIKRDAVTWDEADRSADTLWRGGRLQQASELIGRSDLPPLQRDFVEAGMRRRRRRVQTLAGTTAAVFVGLAGAAIFSFGQKLEADNERARALDLARVSVASERLEEDANTAALILLEVEDPGASVFATLKMREAMNAGLSIVLAGREAPISAATLSRDGSRVATGNTLGRARVMRADGMGTAVVFDEHVADITTLAFSPDGGRVITGSRDGTARVWDAGSGAPLTVLEGDGAEVLATAFSPDGQRVVVASKEVRVWSADGSGTPRVLADHAPHNVWSAAFSPDGLRLVTASEDSTARVWSLDGSADPVVLRGHDDRVTSATFSPDGDHVVTASFDGTARVWIADGSSDPILLEGHTGTVVAASFSPAGDRVVTASDDGTARVWPLTGYGEPVVLSGHGDRVVAAAFSPDGNRVVTASRDGTARVWNADASGAPVVLSAHSGPVEVALFDPTGERVLTASQDGTARVWHANGRVDPVVVRGLGRPVEAATFNDDGSRLAMVSPGRAREVTVWSLEGSVESAMVPLVGQRRPVTALRFSSDGGHLVTVDLDGTARVWSTSGAAFAPPWGSDPVTAVAFSPDGTSIVAASRDDTVRVWRTTRTGAEPAPTELGEHRNVSSATFNADGGWVITTSRDGTIKRWNVHAPGEWMAFGDPAGPQVVAAAAGPGAGLFMTVSADEVAHIAQLWDLATGDSLATLRGHDDLIATEAFSFDGTRIVTAARDGTALIWSATGTGYPVVLKDDDRPMRAAAFSRDGRHVFTLSADGTLRRWATITQELLRDALASATSQCLEAEFRERYLAESNEVARARYRACEVEHGR